MSEPIDFVITWVDGSDHLWNEVRCKALEKLNASKLDTRKQRYRNWKNLVFLLRGISKYASWVNHIYIVTPHQVPVWLNLNNPRISVIDQDDLFEDKSILPTFNNCAVELLLHKIQGLTEQFVYFNDDMFILSETKETDFFKEGLPCITAAISPILPHYSKNGKGTYGIDVLNYSIIAKHFEKEGVLKKNWKKYFDPRNGRELIKTVCCMPFSSLPGFNEMHTAYSYLKRTYEEVWDIEKAELEESCRLRFRSDFCCNHHVMRYWQMANGTFSVRRRNFSKMFEIYKRGDEDEAISCIKKGTPQIICINDDIVADEDFEYIVNRVNRAFAMRFPEKCDFEI